jgi:hypothetical protein
MDDAECFIFSKDWTIVVLFLCLHIDASSPTHHSRVLLPTLHVGSGYKWIHVAMNGGRATEEFGSLTAKSEW